MQAAGTKGRVSELKSILTTSTHTASDDREPTRRRRTANTLRSLVCVVPQLELAIVCAVERVLAQVLTQHPKVRKSSKHDTQP